MKSIVKVKGDPTDLRLLLLELVSKGWKIKVINDWNDSPPPPIYFKDIRSIDNHRYYVVHDKFTNRLYDFISTNVELVINKGVSNVPPYYPSNMEILINKSSLSDDTIKVSSIKSIHNYESFKSVLSCLKS